MKTLKKSFPLVLLLFTIVGTVSFVSAQEKLSTKEALVKNLVDSQQYIFYAQNVTPMSGRQKFLTTDYTVNVSKDTIESDLPYFGRAYSAEINPSDGGIKFTSTDFDYKIAPRKKGGWDVSIKPKDAPGVQQFSMSIFENGNASLQVTSTNRQPISFNGYIKEKKGKQ